MWQAVSPENHSSATQLVILDTKIVCERAKTVFVFPLIKKNHGVPSSTVLTCLERGGGLMYVFPLDANNMADVIGNILWT